MCLSRIHHNQPVKPLDRALFWIEYVLHQKEAKHLCVAAHDLTWYQYHSLDVLRFLLACVVNLMLVITKCWLFFCQTFAKSGKKQKREQLKSGGLTHGPPPVHHSKGRFPLYPLVTTDLGTVTIISAFRSRPEHIEGNPTSRKYLVIHLVSFSC